MLFRSGVLEDDARAWVGRVDDSVFLWQSVFRDVESRDAFVNYFTFDIGWTDRSSLEVWRAYSALSSQGLRIFPPGCQIRSYAPGISTSPPFCSTSMKNCLIYMYYKSFSQSSGKVIRHRGKSPSHRRRTRCEFRKTLQHGVSQLMAPRLVKRHEERCY